jgi:hypothetical protein
MMSIWQILSAVVDGEINDRQQATALLDKEVAELSERLEIPEAEARAKLFGNIAAVACRYYSPKHQEKIGELFQIRITGEQ